MQTLYSLLISILVIAAGAGAGLTCQKLWRKEALFDAEDWLADTALGLGIVSLCIFVLAAAQVATMAVAVIVIFTIISLSSSMLRGRMPRSTAACSMHRGQAPRCPRKISLASLLMLILMVAALIPALAPPSMTDWDSLAYHLSVPKLWLEHGGIHRINFISHSNFPMLVEMLYMPGLILHQPVAAKLINFWMGVMLVASVVMLVKRHLNAKAAPLAAIALAGMPIVLWLATTAYIDLATALYTVLAIHLLLNYLDDPERPYLIGSAMAAGFAASTKMTGLVVIPLILAWLIIDRMTLRRSNSPSPQPSPTFGGEGAVFLVIALLVCAPWCIKSIIYTGNPVYPFFYSIFGGRDWTAELARHYATQQSLFGMEHDLTAFLMLPFNLTFNSDRFYDTAGLYVGPIFLVALPILFLAKYRSRKLVGLGFFFLGLLLTWFALTHQSRYLVPGFAVLAALVAALAYDDARFRVSRIALWVVFVGTAIFGIWTLYPAIANAAPVVFGQETRDEYLTRTLDVFPADKWINDNLPKSAKIALFGDTRGFYLDRAYVWADPGHNAEFTRKFGSPEELARYLKGRKVTHAIVNFRFFPKRGVGGKIIYEAIDKGLFEQVYPDGDGFGSVAVYKIR
ncbi:MAG: ArnT family glycosyltransferase [Armatimonadota bacterium]